ncbi:GNAT family N-acetyltransferase [Streptomyces spectabilis]|uniref:GNAT family N-acetyltransferase n=1 Tax=Streptomyces spectabilis TaxID=68270 RepID=UPI00340673FD
MRFHVRPGEDSDVPSANALGEEKGWVLTAVEGETPRREGEQRPTQFFYVCDEGSELLGWILGVERGAEAGYIAVDRVIVTPEHRRRGVARSLVERVFEDHPDVEVLMAAWDPELLPFYQALGFQELEDGTMSRTPPR